MATGRVPTTANSPLTAKGDLFGYSTAPARLAVGNDGEQIVADSSTSTGLRYQGSMAAGKNGVINGGFDIWQRGTSFTTNFGYTADRWFSYKAAGSHTVSRQLTGDTTNLPFIQYCARIQRTAGQTDTNRTIYFNGLESANAIPYAGKTVVFSFYARAGANYSPTSGNLQVIISTGTGTDQLFINGYTGGTDIVNSNVVLTSTWQRFSVTATVGSTATELAVSLAPNWTGTAGANDWCEITGTQLEVGSVPTQFSRAGATIQGELAACQRYYYRNTPGTTSGSHCTAFAYSASVAVGILQMPVTMRIAPTVVDYSNICFKKYDETQFSTATMAITAISTSPTVTYIGANTSGMTAGWVGSLANNGSSSGYIGVSAEL